MNYGLTRRRFGQLAIGGTAAAAFSYLGSKTFAQTPGLRIIGVSSGSIPSIDRTDSPEVNTTELDNTNPVKPTASIPLQLVLQSLDVGTDQLQPLPIDATTPLLQSNEALTGFTSLNDGTLVLAITPVSTSKREATPTSITFLHTPAKTLTLSGLKRHEQLGSLLGTKDGRLIGLVGKKNGTPPIRVGDINLQTGEISFTDKFKLENDERVSTLAECSDGKLYTTSLGRDGNTTLLLLDPQRNKPVRLAQLTLNGQPWNNGLASLVCSEADQLLAFGALRYESPNSLYTVDKSSGNMKRLIDFDVARITLLPI